VIFGNDRRPVGTMGPPYVALPLCPYVSDKKDEPVDEAEFSCKREVGLETLPRAL